MKNKSIIEISQELIVKEGYNNKMSQYRQNLTEDELGYYRQSQRIRSSIFRDEFDLRFSEIKGTIVDGGFFKALRAFIKWRCNYTNLSVPKDKNLLNQELPIQRPIFLTDEKKITYTWIGHSTAVISLGKDVNIMIDPVFSKRASPFQWIGPKRFRDPACEISNLPRIDVVFVSHDHYDHLDENALQLLYEKNPNCQFVAGLNSQDVFPKNCRLNTLDWTDQKQIIINDNSIKVTFVPVCHWSRRGLFDKNYRLWGGFVIQTSNNKKIFYSGDTGYCKIFKILQKKFNYFDLCILPIGAYQPREFLKPQHINPEEAVQVHQELKSKKSVGVHWGTFPLGFEHYCAARKDLHKALDAKGIDRESFITVNHGGYFQVDY